MEIVNERLTKEAMIASYPRTRGWAPKYKAGGLENYRLQFGNAIPKDYFQLAYQFYYKPVREKCVTLKNKQQWKYRDFCGTCSYCTQLEQCLWCHRRLPQLQTAEGMVLQHCGEYYAETDSFDPMCKDCCQQLKVFVVDERVPWALCEKLKFQLG